MLFVYAQMALNADATADFRPHKCDKGLLLTILLWLNSITKCHLRLLRLFRSYFRLAAAIAIAGQLV